MKKKKRLQRHENLAREFGGKKTRDNVFCLTSEHHACYHKLFKNRTFHEASMVLEKLSQKGRPAVIAMLK